MQPLLYIHCQVQNATCQKLTPWLGHGQRAKVAELVSRLERAGSKKQLFEVNQREAAPYGVHCCIRLGFSFGILH